jgi:hypothetical protein
VGSRTIEYKGATITVDRERRAENWYITVILESGSYLYDGWWADSADRSMDEAIEEAKQGAWLDKELT